MNTLRGVKLTGVQDSRLFRIGGTTGGYCTPLYMPRIFAEQICKNGVLRYRPLSRRKLLCHQFSARTVYAVHGRGIAARGFAVTVHQYSFQRGYPGETLFGEAPTGGAIVRYSLRITLPPERVTAGGSGRTIDPPPGGAVRRPAAWCADGVRSRWPCALAG